MMGPKDVAAARAGETGTTGRESQVTTKIRIKSTMITVYNILLI
jgi:hypothetical protein